MMRRGLFAVMILSAMLLAGCEGVSIPFTDRYIDYEGEGGDGEASFTYREFSGLESWPVEAEAGDTLSISYEVEVTKGTLAFTLRDTAADTILWQQISTEDAAGTDSVTLPEGGPFEMQVRGILTGGGYTLRWEVAP